MINYHPNKSLLNQFVAGTLPASVNLIISSHVEMCPQCQQEVTQLTELAAVDTFGVVDDNSWSADDINCIDFSKDITESSTEVSIEESAGLKIEQITLPSEPLEDAEEQMLAAILELSSQDSETDTELPINVTQVEIDGRSLSLPRAIKSITLNEWQGMGKIARARFHVDDDERRMSLLHIAQGGTVPMHTHKGFEITLLLQGSFEDEMGRYQTGDFIWLDGENTHEPVTQEGCVCLTVSSDALHFTQGVSQLLNPLGKLIY